MIWTGYEWLLREWLFEADVGFIERRVHDGEKPERAYTELRRRKDVWEEFVRMQIAYGCPPGMRFFRSLWADSWR